MPRRASDSPTGNFPPFSGRTPACYTRKGRTQEAHDYFDRVLKATEDRFGKTHFFVAHAKMTYADFLREIKDYARLEQQCRESQGDLRPESGKAT